MKAHKLDSEAVMKEDKRLALVEQNLDHINEALLRIEKRFDKIDEKFDRVEERFDKVDEKIDHLDRKFERKFEILDQKIDEVRQQGWSQFRWMLGAVLALFGTVASIFVRNFIE